MEKRVLLAGLGMQGKAVLHDLLNCAGVSRIVVVDNQAGLFSELSHYPSEKVSGHRLDATDPALATNAGRLARRELVVGAIAARLSERDDEHWLARLRDAGVPAGQVKSVLEVLRDTDASALTGVAPSVPGSAVRLPPPRLDEHGAAVRARGWQALGEPADGRPA